MIDFTLLLATAPVFLLMLLIYKKDAPKKEPIGMLVKAFFFGALSILPAIVIELALSWMAPSGMSDLAASCYDAFVVAALTEECCKMGFLFLAIWWSRSFDEYFDGIVYAAFVSLGFACFENISYIFGMGDYWSQVTTGIFRGILAVPAHFLFGVTMGYFFAHFRFDRHRKGLNFALALGLPVLLHGIYDGLLMYFDTLSDDTEGLLMGAGLFFVFVGFDVLMWLWGLNRIKRLQTLSRMVENPIENPFDGRNFPL